MVAFAKEKELVLACNLNHRFTPAAAKAKELVAAASWVSCCSSTCG